MYKDHLISSHGTVSENVYSLDCHGIIKLNKM